VSSALTIDLRLRRLHPAQQKIRDEAARFNVLACGRRFGKTTLAEDLLSDPMVEGYPCGYYGPAYPYITEVWRDLKQQFAPIIKDKSETEKRIETITGGVIELWSLDDPDSSRSRKYRRIIVDEAAKVAKLEQAWTGTIRATLADYHGDAFFLSTPRGMDFFWQLFSRGQDDQYSDWAAWQIPTHANPHISPSEIEDMRKSLPERVYQQEILAEFLEDAGGVFRRVREAIDAGRRDNEPPQGKRYYMGVDLARVQDFTVLSVLDSSGRQVYFERFNQISWERQKSTIIRIAQTYNAEVFLDSTGVGDPIFEDLRRAGVRVTGYQFTNSSKEALIDNLALRIEQNQVRLMDIVEQTAELHAFQYEITPSRNIRMNAPEGMHDDCVIALALSAWPLQKPREVQYAPSPFHVTASQTPRSRAGREIRPF
jgi:hypothetical protein